MVKNMKKKIIIAALVFLLVSFQDVINVTANVDQAQQNIVMTKVLNHIMAQLSRQKSEIFIMN